jgi:hypothetical protein
LRKSKLKSDNNTCPTTTYASPHEPSSHLSNTSTTGTYSPLCVVDFESQFTYGETQIVHTHNTFGPADWGKVSCPDKKSCVGWPDTWVYARGWGIEKNYCRWCPENGSHCGTHHQSPIDLRRRLAIEGSDIYNECIDVDEMVHADSTCSFEALRSTRYFKVDRHALRILQPIYRQGSGNSFALNCRNNDGGGVFGRIDFSRGFSN